MSLNPKTWFHVLPAIKTSFLRFPVSFVFVTVLTVVSILLLHKVELFHDGAIAIIYVVLSYGIVAFVALSFVAESNNWSVKKHTAVSLFVFFLVAFYSISVLGKSSFISYFALGLTLGLCLMFAPYITRKSDESSVWFFNYQTGAAIFFASLSAVVFGGGLSLIVVSVEYLFDFNIPKVIYADIWVVAWVVLAIVYVLANLSKEFDFEEDGCDFPKGVSFIANYILAPLMLVYVAVLYAYFVKVLLQWELPKGNIGWMVSSFGVIGVVTKLVSYPIRNKGTLLMSLFDKYFYYTLIIPLLMLFVAIAVRIYDYGVTEPRYAIVLLGAWLLFVAVGSIKFKEKFHLKYVPMSLAVLAFLACLGPWSAADVSVNSQQARFESLLTEHGLLIDGQVVKSKKELSRDVRIQLSSMADYLTKNRWRLDRIKPLFESLLQLEENIGLREKKKIKGKALIEMLDVVYISKWGARRKTPNNTSTSTSTFSYSTHFNSNQRLLNVSGFDYFVQQYLRLYKTKSKSNNYSFDRNGVDEKVTVGIDSSVFYIKFKSGTEVSFDLEKLILDLNERNIKVISKANSDELILEKTSLNEKVKVKLILGAINGRIENEASVSLTSIRYLLMLKIDE